MLNWDTLLPVHLLWINLVTDTFPAIALGVEPAERDVMSHEPRGKIELLLWRRFKQCCLSRDYARGIDFDCV